MTITLVLWNKESYKNISRKPLMAIYYVHAFYKSLKRHELWCYLKPDTPVEKASTVKITWKSIVK